jgi:adenylate cyclase
MTRQRLTPLGIALAIGVAVSMLRIGGCRPLDLLDLRVLDYRLLRRGAAPAAPEVVIVAVDDASIAELGRWPWSRALVARLIDAIAVGGPAVIGVDLVQSEATAACTLDGLDGALDDACRAAVRNAVRGAQGDDARLADAVRGSQRTVLGYFFDKLHTERDDGLDSERHGPESAPAGETAYPLVQRAPDSRDDGMRKAEVVTQNLPELVSAARGLGFFNFFPDADGIFRHAPLAIRFGDRVTMPLSLAMLQVYWPGQTPAIRFGASGVESVRLGAVAVPVEEDGQLLVNYRGAGRSFLHIPAADVLAGRVAPATFRDKLVLVGVTAVAVGDVRAAPFDAVFPGVEIHATVLDNILRQDFIYRPRWVGSARAGLADVAVIFALVLLLDLALHPLRGRAGALVALGALAAYLVGSQVLFTRAGAALSVAYPALAIGLTYLGISVQHYVVADREKRQTRRMLDLYLSPSLAGFISERPETLKLGGEKSERTVLFSDIKSFTSFAERLEPEQLVELLNVYLGEMTDIVFAHDGMLDKYIGDGVMAVWGAPLPQPDHAARACRAALTMLVRLAQLNARGSARGWPTLSIRIGLNSGPMVFGNMGSSGHLSLTVMGDNVNLGSRLEGINKLYGTTIIASQATVDLARDVIVARELDLVRVKGKAQTVRIYEVLGPAETAARWSGLIEHFHAGLAAYRARDWESAIAAFERAIEARPGDGPSDFYLRRCREHLKTPAPPTWEAVTTFGEA